MLDAEELSIYKDKKFLKSQRNTKQKGTEKEKQ